MTKPTITNLATRSTERSLTFSQNGVGGNMDIYLSDDDKLHVDLYHLDPDVVVRLSYTDGRRFNSATLARGSS